MKDSGPGVLASWPGALYRFLVAQGHDADALFSSCGVDPELLNDLTNRVPALNEVQLWFKAEELLADTQHFGLLVPPYLYQNSFYSLSLAMQSSANLKEALDCMARCLDMINEAILFQLIEEKGKYYLRYELPWGLRTFVSNSEVNAVFATLYHTIMQSVANIRPSDVPLFSRVYMMQKTPPNPQFYEDYFGTEVVFGHQYDQLQIEEEILFYANPAANSELATLNEQMAKDYISRSTQDPLIIKAGDILMSNLRQGINPRQEKLASDLHMSLRQLQRKLNDAGETYTNILNRVRHALACEALRTTNRSISQIAQDVGFSDQSNFTKSFKRWESQSPADYRKQHQA
ncbi:hypothetical protein R50073_34060 [Maricurvus nonylphenolicus]|uniref:AraC family transcriptional regulator n=1 Tax=Maricurvus nonylphenolicus TaxID=1008307 RepID=UPI0036F1B5F7